MRIGNDRLSALLLGSVLLAALTTGASLELTFRSVTGSIKIKGSQCCVAGPVGKTMTVPVTFSATSQHGQVTEMRLGVGGCGTGQQAAVSSDWEPLVAQRDLPVTPSPMLATLSVAVQYRDVAGNVSVVACDWVMVEGVQSVP
jgi:hypothetical protein